MKNCVVMGNGPSSALHTGSVDYACNLSGAKYNPRRLVAVDPWLQFDIISTNYIGECCFVNYEPIPIDIPVNIDVLVNGGGIPREYDIKVHNPEMKDNAIGWYYYATGDMHSKSWERYTKERPGYWKPHRVYVCYVPETMNIHNIEPIESGDSRFAPTGAYALHLASHEADIIDIFGFDSVAGSMDTESSFDPTIHGQEQSDHFTDWYKRIMERYSEVEFRWHTKKD